jgi:hypothetical protein
LVLLLEASLCLFDLLQTDQAFAFETSLPLLKLSILVADLTAAKLAPSIIGA